MEKDFKYIDNIDFLTVKVIIVMTCLSYCRLITFGNLKVLIQFKLNQHKLMSEENLFPSE